MAVPATRHATTVQAGSTFGPGKGIGERLQLPARPAPAPVASSSYAVAADAIDFDLAEGETRTFGFMNLPNRTANPQLNNLQNQPGTIAVDPYNTLHFEVNPQSVVGSLPTVAPQTVDVSGARIPGNLLAGGNTYQQFQATVTGGTGGSSGTLSGTLTLLVGG